MYISSVTQSCPTLCDPMDFGTPGLPVLHLLLELTQTHVHWVVIPSNHLILCCPLCSHLQSFTASGSIQMSQFFESGGQITGVLPLASVFPVNIQDWFPLGWTGWISLLSKGHLRAFSNTTVQKHQFFGTQLSLESNSHIRTWLLKKTIAFTRWTFVGKVLSLLFNMLSSFVMTFIPGSKDLSISWLQLPSAVILEP